MTIIIELEDEVTTLFTNGDKVTGQIVLTTTNPHQSMTIKLAGICQSGIGSVVESHEIFTKTRVLEPDNTLNENNIQVYPFSLSFPETQYHNNNCQDTVPIPLGFGYTGPSFPNTTSPFSTLPPTFHYSDPKSLVKISYSITAKVVFDDGTSSSTSIGLHFGPPNRILTYCLSHLCKRLDYGKILLDDISIGQTLVTIPRKASKNLLDRITPNQKFCIPLALVCEFTSLARRHTNAGISNRFLKCGSSLSKQLSFKLVSFLSPESLASYLNLPSSSIKITISGLRVTLHQLVVFGSTNSVGKGHNELMVFDIPVSHDLDFNKHFEPVHSSEIPVSPYYDSECCANYSGDIWYQFTVPKDWYNVKIPEIPQSFLWNNAQLDYVLRAQMTLHTTKKNRTKLRCLAPLVVLRSEETTDDTVPAYSAIAGVGEKVLKDFRYSVSSTLLV
ncbi:hypothetical protein DASC09_006130 [Saccharomycopsis crataegensis]|uniref:Arrestin-like N-terminal domain-containing protein n=1 Tax=Saccharomycopsis crataegensis TaxID=43959 RepID=A0AAV5QEM5_9ASCO|nr:hypothetical protein DASC09_006130 [Saccharomycopsis crataegensis]